MRLSFFLPTGVYHNEKYFKVMYYFKYFNRKNLITIFQDSCLNKCIIAKEDLRKKGCTVTSWILKK